MQHRYFWFMEILLRESTQRCKESQGGKFVNRKKKNKKWSRRKRIVVGAIILFSLIYITVILWHTYKPLPEGIAYEGKLHSTDEVQMFIDLTYTENGDNIQNDLTIFDEVYKMIDRAEQFIVLDLFLLIIIPMKTLIFHRLPKH